MLVPSRESSIPVFLRSNGDRSSYNQRIATRNTIIAGRPIVIIEGCQRTPGGMIPRCYLPAKNREAIVSLRLLTLTGFPALIHPTTRITSSSFGLRCLYFLIRNVE